MSLNPLKSSCRVQKFLFKCPSQFRSFTTATSTCMMVVRSIKFRTPRRVQCSPTEKPWRAVQKHAKIFSAAIMLFYHNECTPDQEAVCNNISEVLGSGPATTFRRAGDGLLETTIFLPSKLQGCWGCSALRRHQAISYKLISSYWPAQRWNLRLLGPSAQQAFRAPRGATPGQRAHLGYFSAFWHFCALFWHNYVLSA